MRKGQGQRTRGPCSSGLFRRPAQKKPAAARKSRLPPAAAATDKEIRISLSVATDSVGCVHQLRLKYCRLLSPNALAISEFRCFEEVAFRIGPRLCGTGAIVRIWIL